MALNIPILILLIGLMKKILIIFGIFVVLITCSIAILKTFKDFIQDKTGKFARGEIIVVFKPEVSEKDARATLEKYYLTAPEDFYRYTSTTFYSTDDSLEEYVLQLKNVSSVEIAQVVGRNRGAVKPWIVVDFSRPVSRDEIGSILSSYKNLYLDPNFYSLDIQNIKVSVGKEKYYSELLQRESTVKYSTVNVIMGLD